MARTACSSAEIFFLVAALPLPTPLGPRASAARSSSKHALARAPEDCGLPIEASRATHCSRYRHLLALPGAHGLRSCRTSAAIRPESERCRRSLRHLGAFLLCAHWYRRRGSQILQAAAGGLEVPPATPLRTKTRAP